MKKDRFVEDIKEKRVLASMVLDTGTLNMISSKWEPPGLFRSQFANDLGKMLVRYYKKHRKAPGIDIMASLVRNKLEERENKLLEDYYEVVEGVLSDMDRDNHPTHFYLDQASQHFDSVLCYRIQRAIEDGKDVTGEVTPDAVTKVHSIMRKRVEIGSSHRIDALDPSWLNAPDADDVDVLIEYPDDFGLFFSDDMRRDGFVSFVGGPKATKSWWLMDTAYRAIEQGRKVVYFETSDLGEKETKMRLRQRFSGLPREKDVGKRLVLPTEVYVENQQGGLFVGRCHSRMKKFKRGVKGVELSPEVAGSFILYCYSRPSMAQIANDIEYEMVHEGTPDVIVVDYMDKLSPPRGMEQQPEHVWHHENWLVMRSMATMYNCLVVTATQVSSGGYSRSREGKRGVFLLGPEHFSGTRTKNDEVTGMIGINQTDDEKRFGICRLNWVVRRHSEVSRVLITAGSVAIGRPAMLGTLVSLGD